MVKRILVIRLTALGDVLLATPAVRRLKERLPGARVEWLTEAAYAPLLAGLPLVDEVLPFDRARNSGVRGTLRLMRELRARRYDAVLDLQHKLRTSLLSLATGAPARASLRRRSAWGL